MLHFKISIVDGDGKWNTKFKGTIAWHSFANACIEQNKEINRYAIEELIKR